MGIANASKLCSASAALPGFVHTVRQRSVEVFATIEAPRWALTLSLLKFFQSQRKDRLKPDRQVRLGLSDGRCW